MSRRRRSISILAALAGVALLALALRGANPPTAPPVAAPPPPHGPVAGPAQGWLGLDYNGDAPPAQLRDFVSRGIVYDRESPIEPTAGHTPENDPELGIGLAFAIGAGMVPDLEVDWGGTQPHCATNPSPPFGCVPVGPAAAAYVAEFVRTATAVLHAYPGRRILFEPLDEPWNWATPPGTLSGRRAAAEYAAILARLLPASRAAGIPLTSILVPAAVGPLDDGSSWVSDLYASRPCLEPGPGTCGPIEGWNVHPYGLPGRLGEGIDAVPAMRAQMRSGQDNIVASEIGFCAADVNNGARCDANRADVTGSSAQAASWLTETLQHAAAMHRAGWLRALLLWERDSGTGWSMQYADGRLTAQGRALELFAASPAGR